jgi:hypothetical protein
MARTLAEYSHQTHERPHRLFGLALLGEADDGVERQHGGDDSGVDELLQHQRDQRGGQEDVDEWTAKLVQKNDQRARRRRLRQLIRAVALEAATSLVLRQPM